MPKNRTNPTRTPTFAAIDFETADYGRDSACALSIVLVEGNKITGQETFLIRPPRKQFIFTYIHGITWADVEGMPDFRGHWPGIAGFLEKAEFLVAHNSGFDRRVMQACCERYGLQPPAHPYLCTMRLARRAWEIYPTKLSDVCARLEIPLKHHDAASDALAAAKIALRALKTGFPVDTLIK